MAKRPPPAPYASALALAATDPDLLSRAVRGELRAAFEGVDPTANYVAPSVPALVWAGYLRREEGAVRLTERGAAVLERQRAGRPRLPAPVQSEIGTGHIWAAPSLSCEEAAPHVQPQLRNLPAIARLVAEHGFTLEGVPGDPGSRRVVPPRGEGYGTLDFDDRGALICCAWELSERREHRHRIMDLAAGISEAQLVTWLRWGREAARYAAACTPRRLEELLRVFRLRFGALGENCIYPAQPGAPPVASYAIEAGLTTELRWRRLWWGEAHDFSDPHGAAEADVAEWLAPWSRYQTDMDKLGGSLLAVLNAELVYHPERSARCADLFDHYEVCRAGAVLTRLCTDGATLWLLEGHKRTPVTRAELLEHLSAPPTPAPQAPEVAQEEPPAPALSNEPPPLIREVRALAASYDLELDVVLDTATQRKRGRAASCWKVTTAAYKGGRILCRIEVHADHVRVRGDWTEPHNALDRVRAVLDMQTLET